MSIPRVIEMEPMSGDRYADVRELLASRVRADWPKREHAPFNVARGITVDQIVLRVAACFVSSITDQHAILEIQLDVPDQRDGDPTRITFTGPIEWPDAEEDRAAVIRKALGLVLQHEVDEAIRVHGDKLFDPHKHQLIGTNVR